MLKERFYVIDVDEYIFYVGKDDDRDFYNNYELSIAAIKYIVSKGHLEENKLECKISDDGKVAEYIMDTCETTLEYEKDFRGYVIPIDTWVKFSTPSINAILLDNCGVVYQVIDIVSSDGYIDYTVKQVNTRYLYEVKINADNTAEPYVRSREVFEELFPADLYEC